MPTYRVHTQAGIKGPFSLRVILKGIEIGKIPPSAKLEEVESGRLLRASDLGTSRPGTSEASGPQEPPLSLDNELPQLLEYAAPDLGNAYPQHPPHHHETAPGNPVFLHVQQQTNASDQTTPMMALVGFISSLLCCWPIGLTFSIMGYRDASRRGGAGQGLSLAGIIISGLMALLTLIWFLSVLIAAGGAGKAIKDQQEGQRKGEMPSSLEPGELSLDQFADRVQTHRSELLRLENEGASYQEQLDARTSFSPIHAYVAVRIKALEVSDSSGERIKFAVGWGQPRVDSVWGEVPATAGYEPMDPRTGQPIQVSLSPQSMGYLANHLGGLDWMGDSTITLEARGRRMFLGQEIEDGNSGDIPFDVASKLSKDDVIVLKLVYPDEYGTDNPERLPRVEILYSPYEARGH